MQTIRKDVIVVGLGAFGSAAAWRLAERGIDVAGIEQYGPTHNLGGSHGTTRLFRIACREHPGLVPIVRKSRELWQQLSAQTGHTFFSEAPCLHVGAPDSGPIAGSIAAAEAADVPIERLTLDEVKERFPAFGGFGPDDIGVLDLEAGRCFPELIVANHNTAAERAGASLYPHTKVIAIEYDGDLVRLQTPTVTFEAPTIVLAAGIWNSTFIDGLPLRPRRIPQYWYAAERAEDEADHELDRFPAFTRALPEGMSLWGHGASRGHHHIKIGVHDDGVLFDDADPDNIDRHINPQRDFAEVSRWVVKAFPRVNPTPVKVIPCVVDKTPDGQFLLGRLADQPNVVIAGGDSGHGFKHCAGLGELIAQIVTEQTPFTDISFMDPNRSLATP